MKVATDNTNKTSRYLAAVPKQCQLPGCRTPFDQACFRGQGEGYYCSRECAEVGVNASRLNVEPLLKKSA
jgi:hypothetical protein